jgi:hypothetical protein
MCTSYDLLRAFHHLDASAFRASLAAMDRAGVLGPYLRELPSALKLAFIDLCLEQRFVCVIPALTPPSKVAQPPAAPRLLVNKRTLPRALRVLVHDENVARTNRYATDYRAYLERYCALIDAAQSPAELQALGAPAPAFVPATEPGLDFDGDDDLVWDFDRRVERLDDSVITHRVHVKTFQFRDAA